MIRHAGRALALFAVGALLAGGAWAQGRDIPVLLTQSVSDTYFVAAELLGSADGTVVQLSSAAEDPVTNGSVATRPAVRLTLTNGNEWSDNNTPNDLTDDTNTPVAASVVADNTAELTFTLTGAVFAQNVGGSMLDLRAAVDTDPNTNDNATVNALSAEVVAGGNAGDGSVTFLIEATGSGLASGQRISFWLPDLRVTPAVIGRSGDDPVYGVGVLASLVDKRAIRGTSAGAVPFPPVVGGRDAPKTPTSDGANNLANRWVLGLGQVVGITLGDPSLNVATVALADRTKFATSTATYAPKGSTTTTNALGVGTLTLTVSDKMPAAAGGGTIWTLDPSDPAVEGTGDDADLDNSLAGNIDVLVRGAFKTGDMVLYGDDRTAASLSGGMAAASIPITAQGASAEFIYVPGGVDDLRPGTITSVASRNFSRAGNSPGKPVMSGGTISYAGVDIDAYAYGVVKGGGSDSSFLRVRCASAPSAAGCTVFLDCHDQAGMNYFDQAGTIGTGATVAWSSDDVASVLGGGWSSGRGACDLLSDGTLEVQHMVRSAHVLVNNSAVVGRSLSEARLASIDKALSDICKSVDGHWGRDADPDGADDDLTTAADNVSAVAATVCKNANADPVAANQDANGPNVIGL